MKASSDVIVVGMGIVGLAHAWAAAKRGKSVIVIDRQPYSVGASVRNFGFVTITGQERGEFWNLARRAKELWLEVCEQARIPILHKGLAMVARRPEATAVLESFMDTEMGDGCSLVSGQSFVETHSELPLRTPSAVLISPHEVRVEAREALAQIADWLQQRWGVRFETLTSVLNVSDGVVTTSRGAFKAEKVFVCPGDDLSSLYPELMAEHGVSRCTLQMLRLEPLGFTLPHAVMSDLGLLRYRGYAELAGLETLKDCLEREQAEHLKAGVHLIVVQSADGSLVVGDSHVYGQAENPFASQSFEHLILDEFSKVFNVPAPKVCERWVGTYATAARHQWFVAAPEPKVRLTVVTTGAGMSTAFGIGEKVVQDALG
ncbi:MAG: TIGR03364 family FAD-dependent oxidoreductase [Alphaproteobacteria bacterium PA3]|nr:MAG: TIGR03364 family FAD-dependent oxidoreductase [Alphaproteobacteria bacterium PA3]